jgi:hypothetical protein
VEVSERAERLRVLLSVGPWSSEIERAIGELPPDDVAKLDGLDEEDLALANACAAVERDLRERAFAALERLAAAINTAGEAGSIEDRIANLGEAEFRTAARAVCELGWIE